MWVTKRELDEQAARHGLAHTRKIAPPLCILCKKNKVRKPGQTCKSCKKLRRQDLKGKK